MCTQITLEEKGENPFIRDTTGMWFLKYSHAVHVGFHKEVFTLSVTYATVLVFEVRMWDTPIEVFSLGHSILVAQAFTLGD